MNWNEERIKITFNGLFALSLNAVSRKSRWKMLERFFERSIVVID